MFHVEHCIVEKVKKKKPSNLFLHYKSMLNKCTTCKRVSSVSNSIEHNNKLSYEEMDQLSFYASNKRVALRSQVKESPDV